MSRLNHSPAPWLIFNLPEASRICIETKSGHVVCEVHTYPRQRAPKANAQIISAAPDMLEALISITKIMEEVHCGPKVWKQIMDAIGKATL
jgi:hypothetical protein